MYFFISSRGHTNTLVTNGNGLFLFVEFDFYGKVAQFACEFTNRSKFFQFLGCIDRITHQLTKKDFMIGVKEFLNDWKNILGVNGDVAFLFYGCHIVVISG